MLSRTLMLAVLAIAATTRVAAAEDLAKTQLAGLHTAARCADKTSPYRVWCFAADFDKGVAADLPKGKNLVGLTIKLRKGKDIAQALSDDVNLVKLAVDDKGRVKLTDTTPDNDKEREMIMKAVMEVAMVFKGKSPKAKLPAELAAFIKAADAKYVPAKVNGEWTWTGAAPSRARKVGDVWVVIETPADGAGVWASILTEAWE